MGLRIAKFFKTPLSHCFIDNSIFLVWNLIWNRKDGWEPLCKFLGETNSKHANSGIISQFPLSTIYFSMIIKPAISSWSKNISSRARSEKKWWLTWNFMLLNLCSKLLLSAQRLLSKREIISESRNLFFLLRENRSRKHFLLFKTKISKLENLKLKMNQILRDNVLRLTKFVKQFVLMKADGRDRSR